LLAYHRGGEGYLVDIGGSKNLCQLISEIKTIVGFLLLFIVGNLSFLSPNPRF
jgi:hypothetical protein